MVSLLLTVALSATPAFPFDDAVSMKVTQVNELRWTAPARPVQHWIFTCGDHVKTVLDGAVTQVTLGELVTEDGVYTHCGMVGETDGQVSTPYPIPNFSYHYSYWPMAKLLAAMTGVGAMVGGCWGPVRRAYRRRQVASMPVLGLAAPLVVADLPIQPATTRRHP